MKSLYEKALESKVKNFFVVRTYDFKRVIKKLAGVVQEFNLRTSSQYKLQLYGEGLETFEGVKPFEKEGFVRAVKDNQELVFVFRNFLPLSLDETVQFTEKYGLEGTPVKVFVLSPDLELPYWLRPHYEEIEDYFPSKEEVPDLEYAEGLTSLELYKANEEGNVLAYRERILKQSGGILEVFRPQDVDRAVGLGDVIELIESMYLSNRGRGTLLLGVPGTGKTLIAKNLALKYPVVKFNVSAVYSKYVGESEQRLRSALKTLEQFGKCIVFIDEFEKALAQNRAVGVDTRIVGEMLSFLQDRGSEQYFIATANDVRSLPLEVIRPERWDFILGLLPPPLHIRNQVIDYYAQKYSMPFDTSLAKTEKLTPADIASIYRVGSVVGLDRAKRFVKLTKDLSEHFEKTYELVKRYAVPVYEEDINELV